jgi:A/G-specific adenine glycosylase
MLTTEKRNFIKKVYGFYKKQGRHTLLWRKTVDPYKIAISEIMLQQTQVSRVEAKYKEFLKHFPTIRTLSQAKQKDVLKIWLGLGYNRRAKFLHSMAKIVVSRYKGVAPKDIKEIEKLPGIGPYTARAIATFAYNQPHVLIETNIRTVFIHHFFSKRKNVSDKEIESYLKETLDQENPRVWYWALMDYGSFLKQSGNVAHRKSSTYAKQSAFDGSKRQIRGAIIRLLANKPLLQQEIIKALPGTNHDVIEIMNTLIEEGFIRKSRDRYRLN